MDRMQNMSFAAQPSFRGPAGEYQGKIIVEYRIGLKYHSNCIKEYEKPY